jgi:hypothetical protein
VKDLTVTYGVASATESTLAGVTQFAMAPGAAGYTGEVFNSFSPFEARYVKFDIDSNWGDVAKFYGLSEVRFEATSDAPLVRPLSARATSELIGGHNRRVGNAVDGVGQTTTDPNGWPSDTDGMWLSASGDTTPTISFDLGGVHAVDAMVVYNYNEPGGWLARGVREADVSYSTDNATWSSLGTVTFARATGDGSNPGQLLPLGGVQARYVKIDVSSNYGDGSYTGLNEVEMYATPLERMPLPVQSVTSSSDFFVGASDRRAVHLIDGTGQFAGTHSTGPESTMWLSAGLSGGDGDPELVFALDQQYLIQSMRVWNYNEPGGFLGRGVDEMEVLASLDGLSYTSLGVYSLPIAPGSDNVDFSQLLDLPDVTARYIKFDILSNHNGVAFPAASGSTDNAFVGLSEVQFIGVVPEPATLLIWSLLAGLGIGVGWRRRK